MKGKTEENRKTGLKKEERRLGRVEDVLSSFFVVFFE